MTRGLKAEELGSKNLPLHFPRPLDLVGRDIKTEVCQDFSPDIAR